MKSTEKRAWYNGHTKHGKDFHQWSGSSCNLGIILAFSKSLKHLKLSFYKLV